MRNDVMRNILENIVDLVPCIISCAPRNLEFQKSGHMKKETGPVNGIIAAAIGEKQVNNV